MVHVPKCIFVPENRIDIKSQAAILIEFFRKLPLRVAEQHWTFRLNHSACLLFSSFLFEIIFCAWNTKRHLPAEIVNRVDSTNSIESGSYSISTDTAACVCVCACGRNVIAVSSDNNNNNKTTNECMLLARSRFGWCMLSEWVSVYVCAIPMFTPETQHNTFHFQFTHAWTISYAGSISLSMLLLYYTPSTYTRMLGVCVCAQGTHTHMV